MVAVKKTCYFSNQVFICGLKNSLMVPSHFHCSADFRWA